MLPALSQSISSQKLPVSASPCLASQALGLTSSAIRFKGDGEKPPGDQKPADKESTDINPEAPPVKSKGWFSRLGKVVDRAKQLGGQATAAVTATVKETVQKWHGTPASETQPPEQNSISPVGPEVSKALPAPACDIQATEVMPATPPKPVPPSISAEPVQPPTKKSVMAWVKETVPGVGQAMSFIDEQMKSRFLKELLQQTDATSLLPRLNGFAKEDLQTALTEHPSRDRSFYRAVFSEVSEWVNKQESRRQYATTETFLNEHWTQLVQQSETVQQFQARMNVYQGVADLLAAQGEMLQGLSPDGVDTTPLGLGTDWRTTFKVLDDIQQTHPPLWQFMTVLGKGTVMKGVGAKVDKQTNSVLFGNFMVQLLSLRDSIQPNRFRMMAQWLDKVPQEKLEAFVQQPDSYMMLRSDLGAAMPEAWWERYHREQFAKPDSLQAPSATLIRALYELSDMLTPAY